MSETGSYRALRGATVLVAEDDHVVRRLILDVLAELGYRALEAADGTTGLGILLSDVHVDLLVTDIGLPEINGRQLADRARMRRPALKILFITGYADHAETGIGTLVEGMQMLVKPFQMEALAQRVQEMIEA